MQSLCFHFCPLTIIMPQSSQSGFQQHKLYCLFSKLNSLCAFYHKDSKISNPYHDSKNQDDVAPDSSLSAPTIHSLTYLLYQSPTEILSLNMTSPAPFNVLFPLPGMLIFQISLDLLVHLIQVLSHFICSAPCLPHFTLFGEPLLFLHYSKYLCHQLFVFLSL